MTDQPSKRLRRRLFEILEIAAIDDRKGQWFSRFMIGLILLNVVAVICETVDVIYERYEPWFWAFEIFTVTIFTVELLARIWIATEHIHYPRNQPFRSRLRYLFTPYALIDLAAILPFYLTLYLDLRLLRVFRLLRLLKLVRYSPALNTLADVIYNERRALLAAGVIMLGLIVFSATIMFYIERGADSAFTSIPESMWWSLATLTTVGYGDMIPATAAGKVFGGILMIFGLMLYALPVGIIASGFASEIRRREFVVTQDTLSRVPLFADLDLAALTRIASLLRARIFNAGDVLTRQGEHADSMYFILSGKVDIRLNGQSRELGPGEFFGEIALLSASRWYFTATVLTRAQLMLLESSDLHHLMNEHPHIGQQIVQGANDKLDQAVTELGLLSEEEVERVRAAIRASVTRLP